MAKQTRVTDLPDLGAGGEIVPENIRAAQITYAAAMLEELKMFQVMDRLSQLFQLGLLAINRKPAGRALYKYWREKPLRLSDTERRNVFSSVLGQPGGDDGAAVNREFNDLWLRFVSQVAGLARQSDNPISETTPVDEISVRSAALDLARNLSLHGAGIALFAAADLQKQIEASVKLLSDPEIKSSYGARDMWQVIEQVARIDLGGASSAVRYRTMATRGAVILSWLAGNVQRLQRTNQRPLLRARRLSAPTRVRELVLSAKASDGDLVNACEQWLAVSGGSDQQIDNQSPPVETVRGTSAK